MFVQEYIGIHKDHIIVLGRFLSPTVEFDQYAIGVIKKLSLEGNNVSLATAHPSKFSDVVKEATGINPELPENLKNILNKKEKYDKLPRNLEKIKDYILERK